MIPKKMARLPFLGLSSIFVVQNELFIPQIMARLLSQGYVVVLEIETKLLISPDNGQTSFSMLE